MTRILTTLVAAAMLFGAAAGCHSKKDKTTPGSTMGDAGEPARTFTPPPAQ